MEATKAASESEARDEDARPVTLFLCGDVMPGRGIDQVLPHPSAPHLYESYVRSALDYVSLAERVNGPIARPVAFDYIWGDALATLARVRPAARIINLETSVTTSEDAWPGKGIHYRMHPANLPCLSSAGIQCCVLANNHVLDWGARGLEQTQDSLRARGLATAGAGRSAEEAGAPVEIDVGSGRVRLFAWCMESAGVLPDWAARKDRPGVNFLDGLSEPSAERVARHALTGRQQGDITIVSLHWGGNWGYWVEGEQRDFARHLIDRGVDIVYGHSSHHPMGIEIYRDRPIFYGCGDFLNDYEGIGGHGAFRPDLVLMYFPTLDARSGRLLRLQLAPMRIRRFRLQRADEEEARWLLAVLDRECRVLGSRVERLEGQERQEGGDFLVRW